MSGQNQKRGVLCELLKRIYRIPCRVICILVLITQSCFLDYYLAFYNSPLWSLWAIGDLVVLAVFLAAFIISYRTQRQVPPTGAEVVRDASDVQVATISRTRQIGGELPLGYVAWLLYSAILSAKIGLIFGISLHIAQLLTEETFFGVNLLRTTLSLTSIVFFTLVVTHHDAPAATERQAFMESLSSSVAIDILDAVSFLDVLYTGQSHVLLTFQLHRAIIAISCINMLLPTVLLFGLSRTQFGRSPVWLKRLRFAHRALYFLVVNIPMLVIRLLVWHVHKKDASVFLIKNTIGIGVSVREVYAKMTDIDEPDEPTNQQEMVELQPAESPAPKQHADSNL